MEFPQYIKNRINQKKMLLVVDSNFLKEELDTLQNMTVSKYYKHIIDNIDLDPSNPQNSYVMWLIDKVDYIDIKSPSKINDGHVSLPDIDTDVNVQIRDRLLKYLKDRWGHEYVAQMITFSRLQGKAALKEVFKARKLDVISIVKKHRDSDDDSLINPFEICNEITPFIPHESEIMGDLQTIREETGDDSYGILRWTIDHVSAIIPFYEKFKPLFDQAIRLEGVKKSQSKHAAGIVISSEPINQLVPMVYDPRSKEQVIGLEMFDAEGMGCVKFDFLGVATLDKLKRVQDLVRGMGDKLEADLIEDYLEESEEND